VGIGHARNVVFSQKKAIIISAKNIVIFKKLAKKISKKKLANCSKIWTKKV
jgi:hypothetical protein